MDTTAYLSKMAAGKPVATKSALVIGSHRIRKQSRRWVGTAKSYSSVLFWLLSVCILSGLIGKVVALEVSFCTPQNTGENYKEMTDLFQSHGLCADECRAKYAFAIVQGSSCWCSDYSPDKSAAVKTSNCDSPCPGFDQEKCGNIIDSLYAYIRVGKAPTGTKTLTTSTFTSSRTKTSGSSSTNTASKTSSAIISTITTSDGRITTVTAIPTGNQSVLPADSAKSSGSFFSNTGKVVGLFVGLAILIGLIVLALMFLLHRRKQNRGMHLSGSNTPEPGMAAAPGGGRVFGLFGGGRTSEKNGDSSQGLPYPPPTATHARISGSGVITVDQRLEPDVLHHSRGDSDNVSRLSLRSLRDEMDYSRRVLRVTNGD